MASIITLRAPSPSSSSSTTGRKYQVFLSFRGDDTRYGFTDHLFEALKRENILVFRDNEELPRGGVIDLVLMKAIKQSQFAIIVLSEKYAGSTSCLDELDEINKCRETTGITVFPVFYHVDPSDVQNLTGIFATELAKHVTVEVERIENWKKALMEVGKIAGWECTRTSPQTKVIEEIVNSICSILCGNLPSVPTKDELKLVKELSIREEKKKRGLPCSVHKPPDFTVGLDVPLKVLTSQLLKDKEQQILVTAPGGCGKTTLVTMLCQDEQIKRKFKDKIFFAPVTKNFDQMAIANQLFRHISDDQVPEFQNDEDAIHQLEELLMTQTGSNPVLLILDDVWSGSEYRLDKFMFDMPNYNILVTSRTTTLPGFSFTYTLNPLNDEDAMTLLCHSLKDGSHISVEDIKKIVKCCGGFPLALKVTGTSLYKKLVEIWRSKAKNWSNGHSIFTSGSGSDLLNCLRKSLEFSDIDFKFKECFMDLGSFSENQRIPVRTLIDIGVELYELDEDGNDTITILHELATPNLINLARTRDDALCRLPRSPYEECEPSFERFIEESIHQNKFVYIFSNSTEIPEWFSHQRPDVLRRINQMNRERKRRSWIENELCKIPMRDFHYFFFYNACCAPSGILEWCSHRSDVPRVTIPLPPNLYNDSTWMGLVLCTYFALDVNEITNILNLEVHFVLSCDLKTHVGSVEPFRVCRMTKENIRESQLCGFIWLFYIGCGSFQISLDQCSCIKASFSTDCTGLKVQKCGLRLLYHNDVEEFKQTIENSMKQTDDDEETFSRTSSSSEDSHLEILRGPIDSMLKDKGKVMAAVFVGGAALGAAFGEVFAVLHDTVKNVGRKILMLKSILKSLESNLDLLAPVVEDIRLLNKMLGRREEETKSLIEDMKTAEALLRMCSGIQGWNCLFQDSTRKLIKFDEAIVKFFQVYIQAQNRRNIIMILELKSIPKEKKWHIKKIRGYLCSVPRAPAYIGLEVPLKVLKTQLLKEEEQHLLLTAPGGCGKTTLVKVLGHDKEVKGKFKDNIFFVPVSKNLNLMVIVQRLFHHLSDQEPEFQSDEDAINQLRELLTQIGPDPILLILDDVWSGSEFHLEKFKFDIPNYNLMVTSRTTFPGFSFTYNLKPLNDEDAMTLFHRSASLQDGSSHIPVEDIKKIVRSCGGFPLALEVIGLSLNGKPVEVWQSRARKWSNGHSILNSSSYLRDCLRRSLEFSDDQVTLKDYFMDLGSFPEDHRIPVPALIDMWAELYGLDEDGIDVIANLRELSTQKLANLVITRKDASEIKRYYNEDFVTQHKLLRELAIYESSQGPVEQRQRMIMEISGNSPPSTKQKKQLINGRLLSISTNELFSSSWCNIQAPKVKVLVLNFQTKTYSLPEFVEMDELKVLIITNCGFFPAELRNFQQLGSLPNLKRIRLEKVSIPSLCKNPVLLRSLEKISLFMCNIGHTFGNFIQVSDALPNLKEINIDYCNDLVELPAGLCEVILLKTLSITNCHKLSVLPKGIEMLVNLEVLRLRSCTDLSELPDSIRGLHKLRILDISDCLSIRHLPKHIGELCNLEEIHMNGCFSLLNEFPPSIKNLERLKLVICDEERAKLWVPIKELLTNLKVKVAEKDINLRWLLINDF